MAEGLRSGKLAVILHADVAGSTALVQQDERLAHKRIQDTFHRFSNIITQYQGRVRELRGDAILAEFDRASDAVTAALAFQADQSKYTAQFNDNILPTARVGIAMGEVIIADNTVTGAGVVVAQRVEQLAEPGGVVIQSAAYETIPGRFPFEYVDLGKHEIKGFDKPVRVYVASLKSNMAIPKPESEPKQSNYRFRNLSIAVTAVVAVVALMWFKPWEPEEPSWSSQFPSDSGGRGWSRTGVKLGNLNLRVDVPNRWDTQVIKEKDLNLQGFVSSSDQVQLEAARLLDGTIHPQVLVARDKEEVAHFKVFKLYKFIATDTVEDAKRWMQDRGVQLVLDRYLGTTDYEETRGPMEFGTFGSGEKITMIPLVLQVSEQKRHVWIVYGFRGHPSETLRQYLVFFFYNGADTREIDKNLLLEITNYSNKMF